MRRSSMSAAIAAFVAFITLFVIVETGAQQPNVILAQKLTVAPFVMPADTKLPGDTVCTYFFLTHYGNPGGTAFIAFNHIGKNGAVAAEALRRDNVKIAKEGVSQPYVMVVQTDGPVHWTIHISQSDLVGSETKCLAGIPAQ